MISKGPWRVEKWYYDQGKVEKLVVENGEDAIAEVWTPYRKDGTGIEERDANAQAISALPDLMEACKMAFGFLEMFPELVTPDDPYADGPSSAQGYANTLRQNLKAAIAKAEGTVALLPTRYNPFDLLHYQGGWGMNTFIFTTEDLEKELKVLKEDKWAGIKISISESGNLQIFKTDEGKEEPH